MPCDYTKYPKDWKAIRAEVLDRSERERQHMTAVDQEVTRANRQHAPASVSDIRNRPQAALTDPARS